MTIVKRPVKRVTIEYAEDAVCDRCGATVPLRRSFEMPAGWLTLTGAARPTAALDYCSEECAAQALAARVGNVLA